MKLLVPCIVLLTFSACTDSTTPTDGGGDAIVDASTDSATDARGDASPAAACVTPSDCVLMPVSCCGNCGAYTRDDIQSVHRNDADDATGDRCSEPEACPRCAMLADPALIPTCEAGVCGWTDTKNDEFAGCTQDADCKVRASACCECGADINLPFLLAIRRDKEGEYASAVCEPDAACPECAPSYAGFSARCEALRCTVIEED